MTGHDELASLGWDARWAATWEDVAGPPDAAPGRVVEEHRGHAVVAGIPGVHMAVLAGRLRYEGEEPAVGDWVSVVGTGGDAVVIAVLPRRTAFVRKRPGDAAQSQTVAANVDVVGCVAVAGDPRAPARLERYVAAAWDSGAQPVIVLTKTDACADPELAVAAASAIAPGVDVLLTSAAEGLGIEALRSLVPPGTTLALLGPSGAGKSSLVNALLGAEVQATAAVREDGKGRHTTTARSILHVPGGGCVLDTPGMRELVLWNAEAGVDAAFVDVEELAATCRFADCSHESEPGCAIRAALAAGELDQRRYAAYERMQGELAHQARREDQRAAAEERRKWKNIAKANRARPRPPR